MSRAFQSTKAENKTKKPFPRVAGTVGIRVTKPLCTEMQKSLLKWKCWGVLPCREYAWWWDRRFVFNKNLDDPEAPAH